MRTRRVVVLGAVLMLAVSTGVAPQLLFGGNDHQQAKERIQNTCAGCHKFEGNPDSRFNLKAPDLMWGGSKYQRSWLIGYLTGKEGPLYPKGYRWDVAEAAFKHMVVSQAEADALAEYFEKHLVDPRVKVGAINLSTFTAMEAEFGRQIYKGHACLGCHLIEENGKIIGGPQSASLVTAGQRYNPDWLFRFGMNPQDFTPHSGEFLADATPSQLRYIIGFVAIQGRKNFQFYEPWKSKEFGEASADRGKVIYKQYCSQCHGSSGKGDGPAASGLDPKPAIHANIAFEHVPIEYLYNVINHGGRAVGKSPNMPYWEFTIGQQGVADVMAYLNATFKGGEQVAQAAPGSGGTPTGVCPQPRKTTQAPQDFLTMTNPQPASAETIAAGKALFLQTAKPVACAMCHGKDGNGQGFMGAGLVPAPRNFTCGTMMKDLSDGQLFWIIKNGSPGTGMMSFAGLSDQEVWQLIQYVRSLAK